LTGGIANACLRDVFISKRLLPKQGRDDEGQGDPLAEPELDAPRPRFAARRHGQNESVKYGADTGVA
jgi:hypothetical protein